MRNGHGWTGGLLGGPRGRMGERKHGQIVAVHTAPPRLHTPSTVRPSPEADCGKAMHALAPLMEIAASMASFGSFEELPKKVASMLLPELREIIGMPHPKE